MLSILDAFGGPEYTFRNDFRDLWKVFRGKFIMRIVRIYFEFLAGNFCKTT